MCKCVRPALFLILVPLAVSCESQLPFGVPGRDFVNWESPHVHPLDLTRGGALLLAVNTPDNRLETFAVSDGGISPSGDVVVGLDPVSVRARTDDEAWVVNHVSDSISIVDLPTRRVRATLHVGDEPCDVVFAGEPQRAFVSLSQENRVCVYDPMNLDVPAVTVEIEGEDPRSLATDGQRVYAAIFESGNATTLVRHNEVSLPHGPYHGTNPPPNAGAEFQPHMAGWDLPPPKVGQIVRKVNGKWKDANGADWSQFVTWDLHDHDVAVIDAQNLSVSYVSGLMNLDMSVAVRPDGRVTVIGSEAINDVRFEPNVRGIFARMMLASFDPNASDQRLLADLNPHLDYVSRTTDAAGQLASVSDPRAIVWKSAGDRGYVAGMGSDSVIAIAPDGSRLGRVGVPSGPTGLALDESRERLYVLSKFNASVSVISTANDSVISTVSMFDPTPETIRKGRPHLYNATKSSGLGHLSCASCHVDGRMDQIAWDLGNPQGEVKNLNQPCNAILQFMCTDWHPMKGPLTTQTLVGAVGTEPLHWRGDREDIGAFDGAFVSLMGLDQSPGEAEMAEFEAFLATLKSPPNPFRLMDGSLPEGIIIRGQAASPRHGQEMYMLDFTDSSIFRCVDCHQLPDGSNRSIVAGQTLVTPQDFDVAQLRDVYEKTGFNKESMNNNRGFGLSHDGAVDDVQSFLEHVVFTVPDAQDRLDLEAFVMTFSTDTHAAVGVQATLAGDAGRDAAARERVRLMRSLADASKVGLVARQYRDGRVRGFAFVNGLGTFQSDRAAERVDFDDLLDSSQPGAEVTLTAVPNGSQMRIGVDRDADGVLDGDE